MMPWLRLVKLDHFIQNLTNFFDGGTSKRQIFISDQYRLLQNLLEAFDAVLTDNLFCVDVWVFLIDSPVLKQNQQMGRYGYYWYIVQIHIFQNHFQIFIRNFG